jgi:hypothetical protein
MQTILIAYILINLSQKRFILVFCLGEAPKAVPRGRGRPRGSKNKPKSSL